MELREAVQRRRMVRRFDPERGVPGDVVRDLVALATRAPSAGFSQGWDVVALTATDDRARFWAAAAPGGPPTAWLRGVSAAPVLLVWASDPTAYTQRYAEPDKGWSEQDPADPDRWPVPYWDTDAAMGVMVLLLAAVDAGLGALFFGVPGPRHGRVKEALGLPGGRRIVGVVALGHEATRVGGSGTRRPRRPLDEVLHHGRYKGSDEGPYAAPPHPGSRPPGTRVSLTGAVGPVGEDDG